MICACLTGAPGTVYLKTVLSAILQVRCVNNGVNYNTWSNWARCMFVEYDVEWLLYRR